LQDVVPYRLVKRILDRTVAGLLLLLLAPVFALAFAVLALDMVFVPRDRGSWFYRERRISQGREFDVLKFRVLQEGALDELRRSKGSYARLYEREERNLTRAGRVLKAAYLDELPQLLNVLRGDMSLVGPRPWPISMVEDQVAKGYTYRNRVVAGWTGPAQVRKDSAERVKATQLDLEYIEACGTMSAPGLLWHDLKQLASSVATMMRGRGLRY
jgi:lipopolysaccharide/colanic/teichoic acid biosynthesis glycosyltransferase